MKLESATWTFQGAETCRCDRARTCGGQGRASRGWDGIGTEEAWLTNITTCHTSKSGVCCCLLINGGFSNGPRHATYGHRRATVDRTLQFSPEICQLIHNPPHPPSPLAAGHKFVHFWLRPRLRAATLISNNISSVGSPAATVRFSFVRAGLERGTTRQLGRAALFTNVQERRGLYFFCNLVFRRRWKLEQRPN